MICPNCGSECEDNLMFCRKCGTKIHSFTDNRMEKDSEELYSSTSLETIIGGDMMEEEDEDEDMARYLHRDLNANKAGTEDLKSELFSSGISRTGKVKQSKSRSEKKKKNVYQSNSAPAGRKKNYEPKKKHSGAKRVLLIMLLAIVAVVASAFATLKVKEEMMTKKFEQYYARGNQYYDAGNYKDAKTQYINASNNAFTKEQKIKSYEMVYKIDEMIGGYDQEEIKYLESLIDVDNSNLEYYQQLIILYQNNEQESKIDTLIASAPPAVKADLETFDGTIPVANVAEGEYDKPIEVELKASNDVTIYYTLDGSDVNDSSNKKQYSSPIKLDEEGLYTLRALSVDKNGKSSKEMSVKYTLNFGTVNAPTVTPSSGKYSEQQKIKVTADDGCTIYYTTDGTTPTKKSKKYKKAIKIPKGDSLYYFIAISEDGIESNVVTRAYDFAPTYNYGYNSALSALTSVLVSNGKLENKKGEFENGDIAYFSYEQVEEIDGRFYYIITCEIEDENGATKSTAYYAVSCDTGSCHSVSRNGDSYTLKDL